MLQKKHIELDYKTLSALWYI